MSMKVYEAAGVLHKDSLKTLNDFQQMGLDICRLDDDIPDEFVYQLAKRYGRSDFVLPFFEKEFFMANGGAFKKTDLLKLIPDFDSGSRMEKRQAGVTIWMLKHLISEEMPVFTELKQHKTSRIYRGLQLIGDNELALIQTDGSIQMYLIQKSVRGKQKCRICFGTDDVFDICLCLDECRILFYDNGKYYFDQAEWINCNDVFYLNMAAYLKSKGTELTDSCIFSDAPDLNKAVRYILPCKNGFALQKGRQCTLFFDRDKMQICRGNIDRIMWQTEMEHLTVKGRASIRALVKGLMEKDGEVSKQEIGSFLDELDTVFLELHEKYKDIYLKKRQNTKNKEKNRELRLLPIIHFQTKQGICECDLNEKSMKILIEMIEKQMPS